MGFFNKLFGGTNENSKSNIRAQFKDEKYFNKQIERCNQFMKNDAEDFDLFIQKHGALKSHHYITATSIRIKQLNNYYSKGDDINVLVPMYLESLDFFLKGWSNEFQSYALLLQMTSLAVLFDISEEKMKLLNSFLDTAFNSKINNIWKPDSLIFFLVGNSEYKRTCNKPYEKLYEITQLSIDDATNKIKTYLEGWYGMHKKEPWYDTHLRDSGYSGYWAWETAAVVKKMKLNDNNFKDNPYYPYDMLHWNG
jgi:hypothetical protein